MNHHLSIINYHQPPVKSAWAIINHHSASWNTTKTTSNHRETPWFAMSSLDISSANNGHRRWPATEVHQTHRISQGHAPAMDLSSGAVTRATDSQHRKKIVSTGNNDTIGLIL